MEGPQVKILFIYPGTAPSYPIQLGSLSAYVRRGGHETRLFAPILRDWRVPGFVMTRLEREIEQFQPKFVGFCGYESAMPWIRQFCTTIQCRWPSIRTIVGGYYPSARPFETEQIPGVDFVVQGEGERPLLALMNDPGGDDIPGIWPNPPGPIELDLDRLPWPDRFHNQQEIIDADSGTVKVMAGWGCVYNCTYCQAKEMRALIETTKARDYVRLRSVNSVVNEVLSLKERYQFHRVGFHDDIFWAGDIRWLRQFAARWKTEVQLPFYCAARVEMFTPEVFELLHEAGCDLLMVGIESGDRAFRRKILRRNMSDEAIIFVAQEARKRDIGIWTFNMVGMLNEGYRSMLSTVALNWRIGPDFAMCSKWYPLQGTQMGDEAHRRGLVDEMAARRVTGYAKKTVLKYSIAKRAFLALVKWGNILAASRRSMFWKLVYERLR